MDSFIPRFYDRVLHWLARLSPHFWLTVAVPHAAQRGWMEVWVLVNLALAFVTVNVVTGATSPTLAHVLLIYGALRVLELCVYLSKVVLGSPFHRHDHSHRYSASGYRRTLVLALHNYIEVIFWFAAAYAHWAGWFSAPDVLATTPGSVYFSLATMTTIGYADVWPQTPHGRLLVGVHLAVAVFMAVVILGRFVSNLPTPAEESNVKL